jgi:RHS repeat-associated protein
VNGITTQYLYDGENAIQEKNGTTVQANLLSGLGLDEWYGRTEGGTSVAYVPDALGSTIALADASAAFTTRYSYDPYGQTQSTGAASSNTLQYAGRENDGTGLYYNRARYYHPGLGRFISEDPIGLAGGVNLYQYTLSNPLSYTDPLGLDVDVCFYPGGVGHIGFGFPGEISTWGFYPGLPGPFRVWGPGVVKPDSHHTQKQCKTVNSNPDQDKCMKSCRRQRFIRPGTYNLLTRQCTGFVRDCLTQCGLSAGSSTTESAMQNSHKHHGDWV